MKAKSGKKIEAVKPQEPEEVFEADEASPGKMAEVKSAQYTKQAGKYGQTKLPAHKPSEAAGDANSSSSSASGSTDSAAGTSQAAASANGANASQADTQNEDDTSWLSIKLTDEDGNAVVGEKYEVELPDGTLAKGTLGIDGKAKVDGFEPGKCKVRFPALAKGAVSSKQSKDRQEIKMVEWND